jgi:monofunctional biosynthetic peptidoglycan transglycosylase
MSAKSNSGRAGFVKRWLKWTFKVAGIAFLISVVWVLLHRWVPVPITATQVSAWIDLPDDKSFRRDWVSMDEINLNMPLAAVAAEDQRFFEHHGFDFEAIEKAMAYNERKKGKRVRGASTISQQVAKNVFLWQGRSWLRKGLEVYFTGMVELLWPKRRILEVYLNVAEMGEGIFGVEAASQAYFGQPAARLNARQAALIAAILPSPKRYNAVRPGPYVNRRAAAIQRNMRNLGGKPWIRPLLGYPER